MDKTYAEVVGQTPFDWNKELDRLIAGGVADNANLVKLAGGWPTCACGNTCAIIPRNAVGAPIDTRLRNLGVDFLCYVTWGDWSQAKLTLRQIEARSAVVIAETLRKLNSKP